MRPRPLLRVQRGRSSLVGVPHQLEELEPLHQLVDVGVHVADLHRGAVVLHLVQAGGRHLHQVTDGHVRTHVLEHLDDIEGLARAELEHPTLGELQLEDTHGRVRDPAEVDGQEPVHALRDVTVREVVIGEDLLDEGDGTRGDTADVFELVRGGHHDLRDGSVALTLEGSHDATLLTGERIGKGGQHPRRDHEASFVAVWVRAYLVWNTKSTMTIIL